MPPHQLRETIVIKLLVFIFKRLHIDHSFDAGLLLTKQGPVALELCLIVLELGTERADDFLKQEHLCLLLVLQRTRLHAPLQACPHQCFIRPAVQCRAIKCISP